MTKLDQVAVVTGGASGIGAAVVKQLAEKGVNVLFADVNKPQEDAAAKFASLGNKVEFVHTDVSDRGNIEHLFGKVEHEFGRLDFLVNSAGVFPRATLMQTTDELWDRIMSINLKGSYMTCQASVPLMTKTGGGCIVNIGSLNGYVGMTELFAYSVSKGGLFTMTRNLAKALAAHRIRVNCVNPGWVISEGELELRKSEGMPDGWWETEGKNLPLGRLQTPDDVASAVTFLLLGDSNQITGQIWDVDGGLKLSW